LSNSAKVSCYRVVLWYNNPYHVFTGYVEANLSTGGKSETDKPDSLEHPMWLVTSRSPLLSSRDSITGPGCVDKLFDEWLPCLVDLVRTKIRGSKIAKQMHNTVISKDGVSRPSQPFYDPETKATTSNAHFALVHEDIPTGRHVVGTVC
jgi:hypothetical protein